MIEVMYIYCAISRYIDYCDRPICELNKECMSKDTSSKNIHNKQPFKMKPRNNIYAFTASQMFVTPRIRHPFNVKWA